MSDTLIFILIICFAIIPCGTALLRAMYKRSIVFKMAMVIFISSMGCCIFAYMVAVLGLKSLFWIVPAALALLLCGNLLTDKWIRKPINKIRKQIEAMSKGNFNIAVSTSEHKQDEIGDIFRSTEQLSKNLHETAIFADSIARNDYEQDFEPLSDDDELGKSLLNMRNDLKKAKLAEEERAKEQEKAAWTAKGIAEFSELFRQETSNLEALSRTFISKLSDYVGVVQGGVFILNEDDPEHIKFELQGAVAYNRVKHMEKEFELGIGLVGQCAYEKAPIHLNDVPDDYMEITSGLGEANPRYVLLTPAILNDKVYAVIELASFATIEEYKADFVSKIGEALASTLSMVKVNLSTAKLLEESKDKAEQLAEQSEALKQNYEELQATQEDLMRKEAELNELARQLKGDNAD